ncbi:hypothetical protein SRB5_29770 [Streptomyces sp. RB5]|uniref:Phospholipid/glycerol acyltransferase domain-containing protein n=1 Tax=Streptomyces smaragdinus TaxID=2585196 RepID=A0A7K0CHA2_9ACTN|nr:lysophospholipid acyltransferase family protein [Streptomyces smaragdinus]MQY12838.1 hypothetical protein [Streptomyces smaragdinus]
MSAVWLPTAPCTPAGCVDPARTGAAAVRAVLRLTALAALLLAGIAASPLGGRVPDAVIRRWARTTVRAAGVRVRITGAAVDRGGVLLVAPHVSWLDIPLLAAVRPARMLAKAEIAGWPLAGRLAARGGALFIDRDRVRTLPGTVAVLARALRAGTAVTVFPEGTTWCGRAHGPFRRAAFQAALDAGAPVQPVRITYSRPDGHPATAPAFVGDDTLLASLWRVLTARGVTAEVEIRPPVPAGAHADRRALAGAAEAACAAGGGPDPHPAHHHRPRTAHLT